MNNFMEEYKKLQEEQEFLKKQNKELKVKISNKYKEIYENFIEKNIHIFNFMFDVKEWFSIPFTHKLALSNSTGVKMVYIKQVYLGGSHNDCHYNYERKEMTDYDLDMLEEFFKNIDLIQEKLEEEASEIIDKLKKRNQELLESNNKYINEINKETKSVYSVDDDDYFLDVFDDKEQALDYAKSLKGNIRVREYNKSVEWCKDVFNSSKCIDIEFSNSEYVKTIYMCED